MPLSQPEDLPLEDGSVPDDLKVVNESMFEQILQMDEDEEAREFSRSITYDYIMQAETTFDSMMVFLGMDELVNLEKPEKLKKLAELDKHAQLDKLAQLKESDMLTRLHDLHKAGHFLKGSSATLGVEKVGKSCEYIQNFGARKRKDGKGDGDEPIDKSLANCLETITQVVQQFGEAERWLKTFFDGPTQVGAEFEERA